MKRHRNGEIWDFEHELPAVAANQCGVDVVLGLDGGTTSTVCVCMPVIPCSHSHFPDPLPVLARAVAGCSNHNSVGETAARETLEQVMADALAKSGLNRTAVRAVCLAVSGVNHPTDQQRIIDWLSGYGIAAQALTAIVRAHDGRGPHTMLTSCILQTLDLVSPDELIGWTYADPSWARIAALVPVVVSCAEAGDEVANTILLDSVQELASSVKAVVHRLGLCGEDGKDYFPLVMVGGVLEANKRWDIGKEVMNYISKDYPGVQAIRPTVEPAVGAALLAWSFFMKESKKSS
ncbi:N-acetyl-D-glucosamine kinase-like isoform X2 [Juglans microcarpa x Juglans regia]|uniref:N-acetyl-D-glucosamine kinase-like isoform X2 n=1 Tax=Juglans microcarpa x Juglans regia TaxID=2249226 RepID=UPI001B7F60F8|nr:N-acetyl-D-glucosamine kinase-like isoform X2 [Juglans microcarpa x Juglans regia]